MDAYKLLRLLIGPYRSVGDLLSMVRRVRVGRGVKVVVVATVVNNFSTK